MAKVFYVYVLQSHVDPERFYTGLTDDLFMRLKRTIQGRFFIQLSENLGA